MLLPSRLTANILSRQLKNYPVPILGGKDCEGVTKILKDGETFTIGKGISVRSLHTPCHTQDSICYFVQDGDEKAVFTGDTLFIAGEWLYMCWTRELV